MSRSVFFFVLFLRRSWTFPFVWNALAVLRLPLGGERPLHPAKTWSFTSLSIGVVYDNLQ